MLSILYDKILKKFHFLLYKNPIFKHKNAMQNARPQRYVHFNDPPIVPIVSPTHSRVLAHPCQKGHLHGASIILKLQAEHIHTHIINVHCKCLE